jgi:ribosomal protein S18 acetylase RimI-like enzyme
MTPIVIGAARIGDAPGIANMSRLLIEPGLPWTWTPRRVANFMQQKETLVVTAKLERELVGFALAQFGSERVHLALLGVAQNHQRQGLGRQLMTWVEESAVVAGLLQITLEVRSGNDSARRFYTRIGYRESGSATRYYSGIEDAIKLSRSLSVNACAD